MPPLRGWWCCGSVGFYKDSAPTELALSGPHQNHFLISAPEGRHLCRSESKRTQKLRRSDIGWNMPPLRGWWCCGSVRFYKDSAPTELALSGPHQNHFLTSAFSSDEVSGGARLLASPVLLAMFEPPWLARTLALPKNVVQPPRGDISVV